MHLVIIYRDPKPNEPWQMSKAICYQVVRGQPRRSSSRLHELEVFLFCCCCKFSLLCLTTYPLFSLFFLIKFIFFHPLALARSIHAMSVWHLQVTGGLFHPLMVHYFVHLVSSSLESGFVFSFGNWFGIAVFKADKKKKEENFDFGYSFFV